MMTKELLTLALEALEQERWPLGTHMPMQRTNAAITALRERLAQPEQEPVAMKFPRDPNEGWTIDPAFLRRVKHSIDPETHGDFTPDMEEIETTLLALEVIPPSLYTAPQPNTKVNSEAIPEQISEPVAWIYRGNLHPFDPSDWAEEPVTPLYAAPQRREWVGLTEEEIDACHEEIRVQLMNTYNTKDIYRVLEAKLKEKNT